MNIFSQKLKDWAVRHLEEPKISRWLFGLSFAESSFFPVPPDLFLLPAILKNPPRWAVYALNISIASVLGGMFGYLIGAFLFDFIGEPLIRIYHLESAFVKVAELFQQNAFWAVFTAAFTPIPFKVFTIASGLFKINPITFILASIIGRALRFFIVAFLIKKLGQRFSDTVFRHFNYATLAFVGAVVLYLWFVLK